jgi:hypothetical protein
MVTLGLVSPLANSTKVQSNGPKMLQDSTSRGRLLLCRVATGALWLRLHQSWLPFQNQSPRSFRCSGWDGWHTPSSLSLRKAQNSDRGHAQGSKKRKGRLLSLRGFSCFVLAHNFCGPGFAAWLLGTCLLRPMTVKAEENQFFLSAAYIAARVLFPELS